jgi:hypothetical protein
MATINETGEQDPETTGSNPGNITFSNEKEAKQPMSQSEIDEKINTSPGGESGDDVNDDNYKKKHREGSPNLNKYSAQEDGATSANAGVFK